MRFNKLASLLVTSLSLSVAVAQTTPLSDYFKGSNGKPGKLQAPAAEEIPQWL